MPDRESVARAALLEVAPADEVGALIEEETGEDGVVMLAFATTNTGYPGWRWTVSVVELEEDAPSVLEVELLPGEGALLAPEWVPWADRLEEYRASQPPAAESDDDDADAEEEFDDDGVHDHDDVNDGIDFESDPELVAAGPDLTEPALIDPAGSAIAESDGSALAEGDGEQQEAPDDETADSDPQPRRQPARRQRRKRRDQGDGGDQPEG